MTFEDQPVFKRIFAGLCLAVDVEHDEVREKLFFSQLQDIPITAIREAAGLLAKTVHRFPTIAAWREACDEVPSGVKALPPMEVLERRVVCERCQDSGWELPESGIACPGDGRCGIKACGRMKTAHTYTHVCSCRLTNEVYKFNNPLTPKTYSRRTKEKARGNSGWSQAGS